MPQTTLLALLGVALGVGVTLAGVGIYRRVTRRTARGLLDRARQEREALLTEAGREAERVKAASLVEGRMEALRAREAAEQELKGRRDEADRAVRRAEDAEKTFGRRTEQVERRERELAAREQQAGEEQRRLEARAQELHAAVEEETARLERIAGLTAEAARKELLQRVEEQARSEAAALARELKEQARKGADREARRIIALAAQRLAAEHTAESTVFAVPLPNDEMKGRIIGREGRNIRAFETATGVDLIIDDTPDTVVVSCFDPIRREVARRALEALVTDGRIQPGRIEDIVAKIRRQLEEELVELGEQAAYETGVHGLHAELITLIGRMKYRASYGQNLYEHSKEVAWLAGMMAAELHLDVALAKRGGLLHDVGKVLTHDTEGTHVELGVEVARKYGESAAVLNCIQAHHDDVPHETTESVLVQAADAISGSRPGARREAFETYVKRLTRLEEIANGFEGVEKTNVIQAGREVRVIVTPDRVSDGAAAALAEGIARRIEQELQYPGQIKVVVIRETRTVDFAR